MKAITILTLLNISGIGPKSVKQIIDVNKETKLEDAFDIYNALMLAKESHSRIKLPGIEDIREAQHIAADIIDQSERANIKIICYDETSYPKRYLKLKDYPLILYVRGSVNILNSIKAIAIVGTREPTSYGVKIGERISEVFTENGFTIISGLALGCDTAAHKGCLNRKGNTVAVLASGLDYIYPKENKHLAYEIIENGGCLISEYPIGITPRPNFFVERDRLQSGLSLGVIVVETDIKGGTMHTVNFAIEQNRKLACLMSHPEKLLNHPKVQGNIILVKQGSAMPIRSNSDINSFMNLMMPKNNAMPDKTKKLPEQGDLFC